MYSGPQMIGAKMSELGEQVHVQSQRASETASGATGRVQAASSDIGHGFKAAWEVLKQDLEKASAKLTDKQD